MMVVELFFSWSFSPLSPPSSFFSLLPQVLLHFLSLPFFQPSLFPSLLLFFYFFPPSPYLLSWLPRWGIFGSERIHTFFFSSMLTDTLISQKVLPVYPNIVWVPALRHAGERWMLSIKDTSFFDKLAFPWSLPRLSMFPSVCKEFLILL